MALLPTHREAVLQDERCAAAPAAAPAIQRAVQQRDRAAHAPRRPGQSPLRRRDHKRRRGRRCAGAQRRCGQRRWRGRGRRLPDGRRRRGLHPLLLLLLLLLLRPRLFRRRLLEGRWRRQQRRRCVWRGRCAASRRRPRLGAANNPNGRRCVLRPRVPRHAAKGQMNNNDAQFDPPDPRGRAAALAAAARPDRAVQPSHGCARPDVWALAEGSRSHLGFSFVLLTAPSLPLRASPLGRARPRQGRRAVRGSREESIRSVPLFSSRYLPLQSARNPIAAVQGWC
jgi:hypothetical protein